MSEKMLAVQFSDCLGSTTIIPDGKLNDMCSTLFLLRCYLVDFWFDLPAVRPWICKSEKPPVGKLPCSQRRTSYRLGKGV
jgi:hypothetical protein